MPKQARQKPSAVLRRFRTRCGVFDPTFATTDAAREIPGVELTQEQATAVCRALEIRFQNWWETWIEPELQYLEKRNF